MARLRRILALAVSLGLGACSNEPVIEPGETELPSCASELSHRVLEAVEPVLNESTVSSDFIVSTHGRIDSQVYVDGPAIFPKVAELIAQATSEVTLETYIWHPGSDASETVLGGIKALEERRIAEDSTEEPVVVRMIVDTSSLGVGSPPTEEHGPAIMAQIERWEIDPAHVRIELAAAERQLNDVFGNLHVKTFIIDGHTAVVTGANLQSENDFAAPWHDSAYVLSGDVVKALLSDFDFTWDRSVRWTCPSGDSDRERCLAATTPVVHPEVATRVSSQGIEACTMLTLSKRRSTFYNNFIDNPQDRGFLAAFDNARTSINILSPNLNDDAVKASVLAAVARGVNVRIILSKGYDDHTQQYADGTNVDNVADLYAAVSVGASADPCARLQVRWYSRDGIAAVEGSGEYASHSKYTSIDQQMVIVGSANMDTASWHFSQEINIAIDDATATNALDSALFEQDWSRAIPVEQCQVQP